MLAVNREQRQNKQGPNGESGFLGVRVAGKQGEPVGGLTGLPREGSCIVYLMFAMCFK